MFPDLARDYGLAVDVVRQHPGGFDSDCWVVDDTWFVKMWRPDRPPERLDLLDQLAAAGLPVPTPIRTKADGLCATWDGRSYAVFPFVRGSGLQDADWRLSARALKRVHAVDGIDLPLSTMDEPHIRQLGERVDHPWIRDRRTEVLDSIDRLTRAIDRAAAKDAPQVLCHRDFGGANALVDNGDIAAILDWEQAVIGPREHDVWIAAEGTHGPEFLVEYGARDLDPDHLEYALLARGLRDMAARVLTGTDRPGVETWGFRRIAKLDRDLEMFRPFCT